MVQALGEMNVKGTIMTTKTKKKDKTAQHGSGYAVTTSILMTTRPPVGPEPRDEAPQFEVPEEIWMRAVHRAAHAVAYIRRGLHCARVSILPPKCSDGVVAMKYSRNQDFDLVEQSEIDGHFVALFAGPIAGRLVDEPREPFCKMLGDDLPVMGCMLAATDSKAEDLNSRARDLVLENLELVVALAMRLCVFGTQDACELALLVAGMGGDRYASYQLECLEKGRPIMIAVPVTMMGQ
jgi:hypothetical protein